ncbi:prepilin-type N-terminal cleavage/methylation domain-containing protein [Vibrio sp. Scap24]|nr:prepilin-type N-terminal cleavage/methylation domain-containing protein [Vibrio sp. Scap16]QLE94262.1 prepilin-type N-terminal cleavage/methylation domain-containing protein [Vibrio sp. Scap24]
MISWFVNLGRIEAVLKSRNGFTVIELVVVIVVLGVLAAIAAPRFLNLSSEAKIASLHGLGGSVKEANQLVYSQAVIEGQEKLSAGSVTFNGTEVKTQWGYIKPTYEDIVKVIDFSSEQLNNYSDIPQEEWGVYDRKPTNEGKKFSTSLPEAPQIYLERSLLIAYSITL